MNTPEVIQYLSELALQNYRENIHPDAYAMTAAHTLAKTAAEKICPESADDAALVAAMLSIIDLSNYSAQQAASAKQRQQGMKNYHASEKSKPNAEARNTPDFDALVKQMASISFGRDASDLYEAAYNDPKKLKNYRLARHTACATYPHAFACCRSAYTYATAVAALNDIGDERNAAFLAAFAKRLSVDLLQDPIEPSFFIKMMCSNAILAIGILLLVAGIAALSLGICALAIVPFGATLTTTIGLGGLFFTTAGTAATITSVGLFTGQFFSKEKKQHDHEISSRAVDDINRLEQIAIPTSP